MVAGAEETGAGGHSCCLAATVMLHRGEGRGGVLPQQGAGRSPTPTPPPLVLRQVTPGLGPLGLCCDSPSTHCELLDFGQSAHVGAELGARPLPY